MNSSFYSPAKNTECFSLVLYRPRRSTLSGCIIAVLLSQFLQSFYSLLQGSPIISKLKRNLSLLISVGYILIFNLRLHTDDHITDVDIYRTRVTACEREHNTFSINVLPQENFPRSRVLSSEFCKRHHPPFRVSYRKKIYSRRK